MTSAHHDEGIEILSFHTENSQPTFFNVSPGENIRVLPTEEQPTEKQRTVARVVMVIAGVMLLMSVILVGVTLSMSDHIDEMVRKINGLSSTTDQSHAWSATSQSYNNSNG